jgi:hypothetical protein
MPDSRLYETTITRRIPGFDFKHFKAHEFMQNPDQELEYF